MNNPFHPSDPRHAGFAAATQGYAQNYDLKMREVTSSLREDFDRRINQVAAGLRKQYGAEAMRQIEHRLEQADKKLEALGTIANHLQGQRSGGSPLDPGTIRIEEIPGQRVPFTLLVEIPIGSGVASLQEQSVTIPQEGPFIAVKRIATFLSAFQYQVTDPSTSARANFAGRSNGRFRPISSATDVVDSQHNASASASDWFFHANDTGVATDAMPSAVLALASAASSFRTMQFDGRVEVVLQGSQQPRGNIQVPTPFWSSSITAPFELGALDFFERGESVTFKVLPTHINNPNFGNAVGGNVFPLAAAPVGYPFSAGQFDPHEGIATTRAVTITARNAFVPIATDIVSRLPDGILILGFEGYKIVQPRGPSF